mgnify:CR=1 FL=1
MLTFTLSSRSYSTLNYYHLLPQSFVWPCQTIIKKCPLISCTFRWEPYSSLFSLSLFLSSSYWKQQFERSKTRGLVFFNFYCKLKTFLKFVFLFSLMLSSWYLLTVTLLCVDVVGYFKPQVFVVVNRKDV